MVRGGFFPVFTLKTTICPHFVHVESSARGMNEAAVFSVRSSFIQNMFQQGGAAGVDVPLGRGEIAGIPRVCHPARMIGEVRPQGHLALWVAAEQPQHIPAVSFIHADDIVI